MNDIPPKVKRRRITNNTPDTMPSYYPYRVKDFRLPSRTNVSGWNVLVMLVSLIGMFAAGIVVGKML